MQNQKSQLPFCSFSHGTWREADTVGHGVEDDWTFGTWQGEESLSVMDSVVT